MSLMMADRDKNDRKTREMSRCLQTVVLLTEWPTESVLLNNCLYGNHYQATLNTFLLIYFLPH